MDKELLILSAIEDVPSISQRGLAEKVGISLGTVNILLKKMVREGLIKLEKIPPQRVGYMLTSRGMEEKITKTKNYVRNHYLALEQMRQQLRLLIENRQLLKKHVLLSIVQPELNELMRQVLDSYGVKYTIWDGEDSPIETVVCDYSIESSNRCNWINIHHYLKP